MLGYRGVIEDGFRKAFLDMMTGRFMVRIRPPLPRRSRGCLFVVPPLSIVRGECGAGLFSFESVVVFHPQMALFHNFAVNLSRVAEMRCARLTSSHPVLVWNFLDLT